MFKEKDDPAELPEDCYRSLEDLMEWVFKERVEPNLIEPIHIIHSPLKLSPLAAELSVQPSVRSGFPGVRALPDRERRRPPDPLHRPGRLQLDGQEREEEKEKEREEGEDERREHAVGAGLEDSKTRRKEEGDGRERMRFAQRFETYIGGIEIADGYTELTDPIEQHRRFKLQQEVSSLSSSSSSCMPTADVEGSVGDIKKVQVKKKDCEDLLCSRGRQMKGKGGGGGDDNPVKKIPPASQVRKEKVFQQGQTTHSWAKRALHQRFLQL